MVCFRLIKVAYTEKEWYGKGDFMPKPLDVPWDKIKEVAEKGTPLVDVAKLFNISKDAVRMRSARENWNTPKRVQKKLNKAIELQGNRVARQQSLSEQLNEAEGGKIPTATSTLLDFDQATKDYRSKGVLKMAKLLDSTVIAPPRTWKDYDIADKMMRRLLGIDDNEGKSNTIVSLQLVNDRLMATAQDVVIEGEFLEESVKEVSSPDNLQRELTGLEPVPPSGEVPEEGQSLSGPDYSADSPALRQAE